MNLNIFFRTLNKLERVHLLVIELKHTNFGFEQTNIAPNMAFTRFTKLLIIFPNIERTQMCSSFGNQTQTPYFWLQT